MRYQSLREKLSHWQMMQDNLSSMLPELPHLAPDLEILQAFLSEGRDLEARQGLHLTAIRETNRKRKVLSKAGSEAFSRIALSLKGQYGPKSEHLLSFGVQPHRPRRRPNYPGEPGEDKAQATGAVSRVDLASQS